MGLSTKESNVKYVKVCYESGDRDNGKPLFGVSKKVGDAWTVGDTGSNLTGKIVGVKKNSYDYQKGKKTMTQHTYDLEIQSDGVVYSLGMNCNYYSRSVLNSIANVGDLTGKTIELSIYRNGEGFVSIYVTCDGNKTGWAYDNKDMPKSDDKKWIASFETLISSISNCLAPKESAPEKTNDFAVVDDTEMAEVEGDPMSSDDDLPF